MWVRVGFCCFCSQAATGPVLALPLSMWLWVPVVSVVSVVRQLPVVSPLPSQCGCGFVCVSVVSVVQQLPVLCLSCPPHVAVGSCGFCSFCSQAATDHVLALPLSM
jgi:hypothetical protein